MEDVATFHPSAKVEVSKVCKGVGVYKKRQQK
jgi:hypothetical protein